MKKLFISAAGMLSAALMFSVNAHGADALAHTVVKGDTMWKIAVKYERGLSEIKSANPHISNPDLIYPGQILNIPSVDNTVLSYESEVIRLVNEQRVKNGLKELQSDWELSRVARFKSQDMKDNNYFSHKSPTYGSPFEMIKNFGISYKSAGENIAKGQASPQAVVNAWMNSSGHRANILNTTYTKIGVGYVAEGKYWTQMFIGQ
ncbi:MAG: SafA/ExsA family spore coat assembly protein [Clostridia bacterium]|nr:SafA/ExsA family spore coat assembly protein [Clostridia bacterium]